MSCFFSGSNKEEEYLPLATEVQIFKILRKIANSPNWEESNNRVSSGLIKIGMDCDKTLPDIKVKTLLKMLLFLSINI